MRNKMTEKQYSECEKLAAVADESNMIGQFLDWLRDEKELYLCERRDVELPETETYGEVWVQTNKRFEELLAEYYNIDLKKVEEERQDILADLQL